MNILHIDNIASVPYTLVHELRRLGHNALLIGIENPTQDPCDISVPGKGLQTNAEVRRKAMMQEFGEIKKHIQDYDIIHIHGGVGFKGFYFWLKKKFGNKRFVLHFHGTDLRTNLNTKWYDVADLLLASTPDLLSYSYYVGNRGLIYLPNPIDLNRTKLQHVEERLSLAEKRPILISHIPSQRTSKGTESIKKTVHTLKKKYDVSLDLIEKEGHDGALKRLAGSDICVDWMSKTFDVYGMVSIEAMALGIPTICRFDPKYYTPPLLNSEPESLKAKIEQLISDRTLYLSLSKRGREYVKKTHDSRKVAKKLVDMYETIL